MHHEELLVDDCSQGEVVEELHEQIVDLLVSLVQTFVLEVENLRHFPAFVISPKQEDLGRKTDLDSHQDDQQFVGKVPPIHVVPQKEILVVLRVFAELHYFAEVMELAMDVADQVDWVLELENVAFAFENVDGLSGELQHILLGNASFDCQELLNQLPIGKVLFAPNVLGLE